MERTSGSTFKDENKEKNDRYIGYGGGESVTGFYLDQISLVTVKSTYVSTEMGQSLGTIAYGIIWDFYL